jgi:hypothetical protein
MLRADLLHPEAEHCNGCSRGAVTLTSELERLAAESAEATARLGLALLFSTGIVATLKTMGQDLAASRSLNEALKVSCEQEASRVAGLQRAMLLAAMCDEGNTGRRAAEREENSGSIHLLCNHAANLRAKEAALKSQLTEEVRRAGSSLETMAQDLAASRSLNGLSQRP